MAVSHAPVVGSAAAGTAADAPYPRGTVVACWSPSGGVGTTTLTVSLATLAAGTQVGRRSGVAAVDFDLPFGTLAPRFGLESWHSLADVGLPGESFGRGSAVEALMPTAAGVSVLGVPTDVLLAEGLASEDCLNALGAIAGRHALTVVDAGSALTETAVALLELADAAVVVLSDDPHSLPATRSALAALHLLRGANRRAADPWLVATRMAAPHALTPEELARALARPDRPTRLAAALPDADDVRRATRHGRLLAYDWPDHPYVTAVASLLDLLWRPFGDVRYPDAGALSQRAQRRRRSWLRRRPGGP